MIGRVALVTGAASGLGKRTAQSLLRDGACVVCLDKTYASADDEFINDMNTFSSTDSTTLIKNCAFMQGDVRSPKDVTSALQIAREKWKPIDIVVNCAGIGINLQTFNETSDRCHDFEAFQNVLDVNLVGTFNVVRLAAKEFARNKQRPAQDRGIIINTSSIDAYQGRFGGAANCAAAGGIGSLTLPIARELAKLGIRVVTIAPGYFETPLVDILTDIEKTFIGNLNVFPNRFGNAHEFYDCLLHIIQNSMINGEVIKLDAGCFFPHFFV